MRVGVALGSAWAGRSPASSHPGTAWLRRSPPFVFSSSPAPACHPSKPSPEGLPSPAHAALLTLAGPAFFLVGVDLGPPTLGLGRWATLSAGLSGLCLALGAACAAREGRPAPSRLPALLACMGFLQSVVWMRIVAGGRPDGYGWVAVLSCAGGRGNCTGAPPAGLACRRGIVGTCRLEAPACSPMDPQDSPDALSPRQASWWRCCRPWVAPFRCRRTCWGPRSWRGARASLTWWPPSASHSQVPGREGGKEHEGTEGGWGRSGEG